MANNTEKNEKLTIFSIRMKLLKIWFLKNISLFIRIAIIIIIVLFLTNVLGSESFLVQVLGITELQDAFDSGSIHGWESAIAAVVSAALSVYYFLRKSKNLAIEDIKSRELKIALIKARLYFNENGELCKRVEEAANYDIDGDGKIGDNEVGEIKSESVITGIPKAIGELTTILTTKIETEDKVVEDAELNEETKEDSNIVTTSEKLYTEELGAPEVEEDTDSISLEDKIKQLSEEDPSIINETPEETTEEPKTKKKKTKKNKKPSVVGEVIRALKAAFTPLSAKTEKKEKVKKEKKSKITETPVETTQKTNIEIVNIDETDTAGIDVQPTVAVQDHKENTEKSTEVKTAKEKQIDDILNSLK